MKTWSALLLVAALIGLAPLSAAADDVVVARVNGVDIKQSDLDFAASEVGPRLGNYSAADRKRVLLQYVIENELMAEAGQKDGLDKGPTFPAREKYHDRRALRDAFFDVDITNAVTEDAAKKIYDEKIATMKPQQEIHARHILVATEDEAKKVAERLKNGEDFATVAKEVSKDAGAEGGDLGFFTRGQMLKPFEDAAFALDVGQISAPVQTQFGWHIIKVEEKRDQPLPTFDQVKEAIMGQLVQQKAQEVVSGLRDAAKIEVVDPELKKAMDAAAAQGDAAPDGASEEQPEDAGGQQ
ncbi:MAG TPA: peptidylprolyl isomerase [Methyloceanibacter sp.]|nr:peptidylprolyl isomerase [Methyloceanibacter sp.]